MPPVNLPIILKTVSIGLVMDKKVLYPTAILSISLCQARIDLPAHR